MAFLSKKVMQKKNQEVSVVPHPLLSQVEAPLGLKMVYLQGCVLGTLLDDAEVSDDEFQNIRRIGLSLGLTNGEIEECLEQVKGLKSDDDQEAFIEELKGQVADYPVVKFFMDDFEGVMKKKGVVPPSSKEFLDFIGAQVVGTEDWRNGLKKAAKQAEAQRQPDSAKAKGASTKDAEPGKKKKAKDEPAKGKSEEEVASDDYGFGDKVWRINEDHNGIECSFAGKPSESVRSKLKAAGFRFSGKQGLWYAKDSDKARKTIQALRLAYVGDPEPEEETSDEDAPILASELIELIETSSIEATVEDDDECTPVVKSAEIDTYSDGECELKVKYGYQDDGVAGRLVFEVAGVHFSADRNFDGEHEPFEISGREIEYDDDLDEDAVLDAVESNVSMTEFDPDDYEFDESNVVAADVVDVLDSWPEYLAVDDGDTVYGYDDEDDIDEDYEIIETVDEAVGKMLENGSQVEFDQE